MPVHQILVPHFFLLFQCFATFAEPDVLKQHSKLLKMSNWWQTEVKFFITCVPCCQSTKSVCHCCTAKISIQFLPLSEKFSNCVKHSLPERLYTILPDTHFGLSIKKPCKLLNLTTCFWRPRWWTSAKCTRDRPHPPAGTSPTTEQRYPFLSRAWSSFESSVRFEFGKSGFEWISISNVEQT